ncbi:hypothetical protein [Nonomuraea fuscirosea]|uniref:hypothetical protein n=1 Tax=Nonomuraea fuscirosea TaxID=1291556 RepID=UPI0033D8007C
MRNAVADQPCREIFSMLAYQWDITAALALVEGREPNATIGVEDAAKWLPVIVINQAHAATVDLNKPVLVVAIQDPKKPEEPFAGYLTIDGWHRIHRATQEDVATLPAHLLTAEEEKQIRLSGGDIR